MRALLPLVPVLLLGACDLSMTRQPRHETFREATLWPDGPAVSAPPEGSVAQDQPARDAALGRPPPMTPALLARGRERYDIACAPCHGYGGLGDGVVVRRGFPAPLPFATPRIVAAGPAHVVDAITRGYGVMYAHADRVAPADRWAIAAYVGALQRLAAR